MTETGIQMLQMFEGCRLKPYLDAAGKGTIGWGHLILPGESFDTITREQADDLLLSDITKHEHGLLSLINRGETWPSEIDALVSLVFNIGGSAFKRSTLLRLWNEGAPRSEVADQFPRWNKASGKVLKGLTRRRCAEAACFLGAGPGLIQAIWSQA